MRFEVIMACHNRRELTVRAIELAQAAADFASIDIAFTVYDDGSTDGTSDALHGMAQDITLIAGDGSAFWAKSMSIAERSVLGSATTDPDSFIVWLNDDVALDVDAFVRMRETIERFPQSILVGAMRDPSSGELTYSGMQRVGHHPLRYRVIEPSLEPLPIEAFNGNLVLVPLPSARRLNGIDGAYSHAFADIDYGLRACAAGVSVLLAPGYFGSCARNETVTSGTTVGLWRQFTSIKGGGHFVSLRHFYRRHAKYSWPALLTTTYLLWWTRALSAAVTRERR